MTYTVVYWASERDQASEGCVEVKDKLRPNLDLTPRMVKTVTRYFPAEEDTGLPAIVVQVTCWTGSFIVWAGTTDEAIDKQDTTKIASLVEQGRLGQDWACAMPSPKVDGRSRRRIEN